MGKVKEISMRLYAQQGCWWLMPFMLESNKWWRTVTPQCNNIQIHAAVVQRLCKSGVPTQRNHRLARSQTSSLTETLCFPNSVVLLSKELRVVGTFVSVSVFKTIASLCVTEQLSLPSAPLMLGK